MQIKLIWASMLPSVPFVCIKSLRTDLIAWQTKCICVSWCSVMFITADSVKKIDQCKNKINLIWITFIPQGCTGRMELGHWWCWCHRSLTILGPDPNRVLTPNYTSHHAGDPILYDPQASVIFFSCSGFYSAETNKPFIPQQLFLSACFSNAFISVEIPSKHLCGFLLWGERETDRGSRREDRRGAGEFQAW